MRQYDVKTPIRFTLKDKNGVVINLTAAAEAKLVMELNGVKVEKTMTFYDRAAGQVSYETALGDLPAVGILEMMVWVRFDSGQKITFSPVYEMIEVSKKSQI